VELACDASSMIQGSILSIETEFNSSERNFRLIGILFALSTQFFQKNALW
jgi:hypothetical protein